MKHDVRSAGWQPSSTTRDAGYCSNSNLEICKEKGLRAYISTSRQQHSQRPSQPRGERPEISMPARGGMDRMLLSADGKAIYSLRKTVWEPVLGQIKGA